MIIGRIAAILMLGTAFGGPAIAADAAAPDFSGMWGRNAFNFEPIDGAPQPVVNLSRMPDGSSNIGQLVGDYQNPILKPERRRSSNKKARFRSAATPIPIPPISAVLTIRLSRWRCS